MIKKFRHKWVHLSNNKISFIRENSFDFENYSTKILNVVLEMNHLNGKSFAMNSLGNFKRPANLFMELNC